MTLWFSMHPFWKQCSPQRYWHAHLQNLNYVFESVELCIKQSLICCSVMLGTGPDTNRTNTNLRWNGLKIKRKNRCHVSFKYKKLLSEKFLQRASFSVYYASDTASNAHIHIMHKYFGRHLCKHLSTAPTHHSPEKIKRNAQPSSMAALGFGQQCCILSVMI